MVDSSAEVLYEDANELMNNDDYAKALDLYTQAIQKCDKSDSSALYNYYLGRSQAHLKLKQYKESIEDADSAMSLNPNDFRAYVKKGTSKFHLKQPADALIDFEKGLAIAKNLKTNSDTKVIMLEDWISKCKHELPSPPATALVAESKIEDAQVPVSNLPIAPPPIKHEWYQTESQVTVSVLIKNTSAETVKINTSEDHLSIESVDPESLKLNFNFHLAFPIQPEQTQIKYLTSKIEIKLKKCDAIQWKTLEINPSDIKAKKIAEDKPVYPSSSKKAKDWDKIVADVNAEEKDEKLEGDAALNKLFQQVYANGSEETRRAMNKSFVESGGTVLSTNWSDVGAKKLDVKPPDGMEWKSWDK